MRKTLDISHLCALEKFTTEYSKLGDQYLFTRITERDRSRTLSPDQLRFNGLWWILCLGGGIDLEINMVQTHVEPGSLVIIRPESPVTIRGIDWDGLDCCMLFVSDSFTRDINYDLNVLGTIPAITSKQIPEVPVMRITPDEAHIFGQYCELLHQTTLSADSFFSKPIARCIIAALTYQLIECASRRVPDTVSEETPRSRRKSYIHDFLSLVQRYHRRERSVAFYASRLFITPKYLSLIIKQNTGRSAAEIIDEYVILEAKSLLRYSGKNIQQISYELNFPNQSTFGKYFKHLTGLSPSEYQRSL